MEMDQNRFSEETEKKIERLAEFIRDSERIVFFGGAGVSTESGVPDFRSKDGLYNQHDVRFDNYSPEYLLSHSCLVRHPEVFSNSTARRWTREASSRTRRTVSSRSSRNRESSPPS